MKRRGWSKGVLWFGVLLALAVAAGWSMRAQPAPVNTSLVTRGTLRASVNAEGRTRVRDLYSVAAPVDGQLERVTVQPGDSVTVNTVVATMRPVASTPLDARTRAEATAALAAARAAGTRAEAAEQEARVAVDHANSKLKVTRALAEQGAAMADEVVHLGHEAEMRRRALDAAIAAVGQARAELARAEAALGTTDAPGLVTSVHSPVTGKILRVLRESAGPVAAGTPLLEMGDVARLEVDADLLSSDAAEVRPGAPATVTGWGGEPLAARVRRIDPAAFTKVSALGLEEQRVHVVLDFAAPPPPGLGHDYKVDVSIVVWEGRDVLRVPSTALFRTGERWSVFAVRDGRARLTSVEVGRSDDQWTVVTRGLSDKETVVLQPSDEVRDGTRVRL